MRNIAGFLAHNLFVDADVLSRCARPNTSDHAKDLVTNLQAGVDCVTALHNSTREVKSRLDGQRPVEDELELSLALLVVYRVDRRRVNFDQVASSGVSSSGTGI